MKNPKGFFKKVKKYALIVCPQFINYNQIVKLDRKQEILF